MMLSKIKRYWKSLDLHNDATHETAIIAGLALLAVLAIAIRVSLIHFQNPDYTIFSSWFDFVKAHGIHSFRYEFSNYNPTYTYFLYLSTLLPISKIVAIKGTMILFDIIMAVSVYYVVKAFRPQKYYAFLAALATMFLPTVLFTGVFWGQFDQFYIAFILFALTAGLRNNSKWAWIFFGIAISIKFQAIFFLPVMAIMCFKRIRAQSIGWGIGSFFLLTLPPLLAGRSLGSLLNIYPTQSKLFNGILTLNAPNLYQWVPNRVFPYLNDTGIILGIAAVIFIALACIVYRKFSDRDLVLVTALILNVVPFLLPAMHERYIFPGCIAVAVVAFIYTKFAWLAVVAQLIVLFSYCPFLFNTEPIPLAVVAVFNLFMICVLVGLFARSEEDLFFNKKVLLPKRRP